MSVIDIDAMFPVMVVSDLAQIKAFYAVFYEPNFYLHLVSPTGVQLGFLVPDHPSQPTFLHTALAADGYVISLEVKNAALAYTEANRLQLNVVLPLTEEAWGQTHFILQDPAGIRIDVVEHVASQ